MHSLSPASHSETNNSRILCCSEHSMESQMEDIHFTIRTSQLLNSGSYNFLWVSLIGSQWQSSPVNVNLDGKSLQPGLNYTVIMKSPEKVDAVTLVRLRLEPRPGFPDLDWHCLDVQVKSSWISLEEVHFPCYRWIQTADGDVELCSDKISLFNDESLKILKDYRTKELQNTQQKIRWKNFVEGAIRCVDMDSTKVLGPNLSYTRNSPDINLYYLRGFNNIAESWKSFSELEMMFIQNVKENSRAYFVKAHWREDTFFGYQCLNGCNPLIITKIQSLPSNLAVTSNMLSKFLPKESSLKQEMEKGRIFLMDFGILDQMPANIINGRQSYVAAPLCLLHYNLNRELKPIAIQLQQTPGDLNPVFLPSDAEPDWLLAKLWVRNADFQVHQVLSHLMRTHLMGEVCCIATLRMLPDLHPLYKLLMPHIKTSLQINVQARSSILSTNGVFDKSIGCGLKGAGFLLIQGTHKLRYTSLCVPDDLKERGLDSVPTCYYAKDALRVWNAIHRFVTNWLDLFYNDDVAVQTDFELQNWIKEFFVEGLLGLQQTGFPQSFKAKSELSKFVTMMIFSTSALHSAVNFSQVDFYLWMPNYPPAMSRPPPQVKGSVKEEDILSYLPDTNSTCSVLSILTLLSQRAVNYVSLCHYDEWYFHSGAPRRLVEQVQQELKDITHDIITRNKNLELPYPYLSPDYIENSVAI